jgi:hypothetical protein
MINSWFFIVESRAAVRILLQLPRANLASGRKSSSNVLVMDVVKSYFKGTVTMAKPMELLDRAWNQFLFMELFSNVIFRPGSLKIVHKKTTLWWAPYA